MELITPSFNKLSWDEFEVLVNQEIRRRMSLLRHCAEDKNFRKIELERCRRNPIHFIKNWVWTFNPKTKRKDYPFYLFPVQENFIHWFWERYRRGEWGHVEKTREQGATYLFCAFTVWRYCFEDGFIALFGSINGAKVDNGTESSILGKLRFIINRLPDFICPPLVPEITDIRMKLTNSATGAELRGETMNDGFGRSGRASVCILDEFAHVMRSQKVIASVSRVANCVILNSTPQGLGNEFARIRFKTNISRISLHWSQHPLFNQEWYEKEKEILEDWQVAQELDISYHASKSGQIYKNFNRAYHMAKEIIHYNPRLPQYVFWDFGYGGAMAVLFIQETPRGEIQVWCYLEIKNRDVEFVLPITLGREPPNFCMEEGERKKHIAWALSKIPAEHHSEHGGDYAGNQRTAASRFSCIDKIKAEENLTGGRFLCTPIQEYHWRYECLNRLLKPRGTSDTGFSGRIQISPDCERVAECLSQYEVEGEVGMDGPNWKPKINEFSHIVTALEFYAINRHPIERKKKGGFREVTIR